MQALDDQHSNMDVYNIKIKNEIINIPFNIAVIASKRCVEKDRVLIISASKIASAELIWKHVMSLALKINIPIFHFTEMSKERGKLKYHKQVSKAQIVIVQGPIFLPYFNNASNHNQMMYKAFGVEGFDLIMLVHDGLSTDDGNYWMYHELFKLWNLQHYIGAFVSISIGNSKNPQYGNRKTIIEKFKEIQKSKLIPKKLII